LDAKLLNQKDGAYAGAVDERDLAKAHDQHGACPHRDMNDRSGELRSGSEVQFAGEEQRVAVRAVGLLKLEL
jgi:hypothetical protein